MSHYATARRIKRAVNSKSHAKLKEYFRVNGFDKQATPMKLKYDEKHHNGLLNVQDNTIQDIVDEILSTVPRLRYNRRINRSEALIANAQRQREIAERELNNPIVFGQCVNIPQFMADKAKDIKQPEQLSLSFPRLIAKR